jgi:hypothetical protein
MPHPNPANRARRPLRHSLPWLLAAGLLGALPALGAASAATAIDGTLARNESLRAEARDDATSIRSLDKGARVQVLFREGAWYRVDHAGQQGWIRLYWVRTGGAKVQQAAAAAPARSIGSSLAAIRARRNQGQVTASLGVRGLSEDELKGAQFDAEQVAKLDTLAVDAADAAKFAAAGPVQGRSVDEIAAARSSRR